MGKEHGSETRYIKPGPARDSIALGRERGDRPKANPYSEINARSKEMMAGDVSRRSKRWDFWVRSLAH